MFGIETRTQMRKHLEQGLSKSATARLLGVSRRTIYNWIAAGELDRDPDDKTVQYGPRPARPTKLDPWKPHIDARLKNSPRLAAARLFREVRERGYPGAYGSVKRYVGKMRQHVLDDSGIKPVTPLQDP